MTELNHWQVKRLAERIVYWLIEDETFREAVAREQAENWTLDEYRELFGGEEA